MSTEEKYYLAISELPACVPKDEIEDLLKKQLNLRGTILDSEEVPGIEANRELTRWVCLLQSAEEVKRLLDEKEVELMYHDLSYNVTCQKPMACEIPDRWANIQVAQEKSIENEYKQKLHIDTSNGSLGVIGLTANVNSAATKIHQLPREVQTDLHTKQAAEILTNVVQWFYIEVTNTGQNLQPYDKDMNYRIESAFKSKDKNIKFKVDDSFYIIDFTDMIEYPEGNKADSTAVVRRDLVKNATYKVPESWGDFKGDMKVDVLPSANQDYKTLEATFLASVGAGYIVTKIERIMNRLLWNQYQAKKKQLDIQNPIGTQNERHLWHGTAPDAVDSINGYGFNRIFGGQNAKYYGVGIYFATNASYSARDNYSRADASGVKKMYYCLVLTGEYTQGKEGMRLAPNKGSGDAWAYFDSVVENVNNPGMFIIFNDTQAYPEYLVSFKKQ